MATTGMGLGATFDSMNGEVRPRLERLIKCLDLTSLTSDESAEEIRSLCRRAALGLPGLGHAAAVCVYPKWVGLCRELLDGTGVTVACATGGFPTGTVLDEDRHRQIADAVADGAQEIDTVIDHSSLMAGDDAVVRSGLAVARQACGDQVKLKVILETGVLATRSGLTERAARMAAEGGADMVKTSTGKVAPGAERAAVEQMCRVAAELRDTGRTLGIKVAGGIRSVDQAFGFMDVVEDILGVDRLSPETFRVGASSLIDEIERLLV